MEDVHPAREFVPQDNTFYLEREPRKCRRGNREKSKESKKERKGIEPGIPDRNIGLAEIDPSEQAERGRVYESEGKGFCHCKRGRLLDSTRGSNVFDS